MVLLNKKYLKATNWCRDFFLEALRKNKIRCLGQDVNEEKSKGGVR